MYKYFSLRGKYLVPAEYLSLLTVQGQFAINDTLKFLITQDHGAGNFKTLLLLQFSFDVSQTL